MSGEQGTSLFLILLSTFSPLHINISQVGTMSVVNEFISIHTQTYTESDEDGVQDNLSLGGGV